jgi:uncharacterized protein (DUF58 family)
MVTKDRNAANHPPTEHSADRSPGHPVTLSPCHPVTSTFRLTSEGASWLAAAVLFLAVGLLKGINLLVLLSCLMLGLWAVNAWLAGRRLRRLRARRDIARPVFAGRPFALEVTLDNSGRPPQTSVRLDDVGAEHAAAWFVPQLGAGATVRLRQDLVLPRRGRYAWGRLCASSGYPLGLARRFVSLAPPGEVVVLPRLGRLHRDRFRRFLARAGGASGRSLRRTRRHPTAQEEFHGLRAFRSGDSPRLIHWRTSARCGEPMVREFEDVLNDDLTLVADCRAADRLEDTVSLVATVCWEWCRSRGERLVLAVAGSEPALLDGATGPEHALRLLECLAVQAAMPAADTAALVDRLAAAALPAGPVLVVGPPAGGLVDTLQQRLNRPVAGLPPAGPVPFDFYERPADHAP